MKKRIDPVLLIIPLGALLLTLYLVYLVHKQTREPSLPEPEYIGRTSCFKCHEEEQHAFYNSHHDLAMDEANENTMLADLYRMQNDDINGEQVLLSALQIDSQVAEAHYSLGLLYARKQQIEKALVHLQNAVELNPTNSRFRYIYGIALNSVQKSEEASEELKKALSYSPSDQEILFALATSNRDMNKINEAKKYTRILVNKYPDNQQARILLESLSN